MERNFGDRSANRARPKFLFRWPARSCRGEWTNRRRAISSKIGEIDATLIFGRHLKRDPARLRRNRLGKSIGPLDHAYPVAKNNFVETNRPQRCQTFNSIKIEMIDRQSASLIFMHEGKCRACHDFRGTQTLRQSLDELRFARAKISDQCKHVSGLDCSGEE